MFNIIKEKLGNVDMKSAGIGAVAVLVAQGVGYGMYKGGKCLYNKGKDYFAARAAAKSAQVQQQNGEGK